MKRTERHRLKENELAIAAARAREVVGERKRQIAIAGGAVVLILVIAGAWLVWRQHRNTRADELFAQAVAIADAQVVPLSPDAKTPPQPGTYPTERAKLEAALPKFADAADRYPSTPAGLAGRYRQATILSQLNRKTDATKKYQEVIDRAGSSIYGDMARLGLAHLEVEAGQYDPAIAIYKELTTGSNARLPVDGVLMQLGRAYVQAGKRDEAVRTYTRIVDEFPQSLYAADARKELETIKKG